MIEKCLLQSTSKQTFNKLTHIHATTPPALTLSLKKQKQKTKKKEQNTFSYTTSKSPNHYYYTRQNIMLEGDLPKKQTKEEKPEVQ